MKKSLVAGILGLLLIAFHAPLHSAELTISVIQYGDARDPEALRAGFRKADLYSITDSDKVEGRSADIRGGHVLFVQKISLPGTGRFSNSTRLSNERADVSGSLSGNQVDVQILLQEGVDVGLRKFRRSSYSGSGALSGGEATVIGLKSSSGKTQSVIKGKSKVVSYEYTTLVVAQLR